jgi:4-amino-4-deoxy-L-arabinose transferase-like glycosyltransferase
MDKTTIRFKANRIVPKFMEIDRDRGIRSSFIIIFILLSLFLPLHYFHGFISPDEGSYIFIANSINHGSVLYKDFIDIKPPGIFYLNSLIFSIFGKSLYISRLVLYITNALAALIIYYLGRNQWNEYIGQLSSILYLIGIYNPLVQGYFVLTEQFMVFFGLLGIFIFLKFRKERYLVLVGILFGIATLFKQPGIFFFILIFSSYLIGLLDKNNHTKIYIYNSFKSLLLILTGFLIPVFIIAAFFYGKGVLNDFMYWSFLYLLSGKYGTKFDLTTTFQVINSLVIIWIPALISVVIIFYNSINRKVKNDNLFVVCWLILFGYTLTTRQFGHYFIQILPPACILASMTLTRLPFVKNIKDLFSKKGLVTIFVIIFFILLISHTILWSIFYDQLTGMDRNLVLENQTKTSDFIISHTEPNQRIISLPFDPSIYFLSNRYPPTKFLGMGSGEQDPAEQDNILISQINKSNVPYIIINTRSKDWMSQDLHQLLTVNYINEKTIGTYEIYKKMNATAKIDSPAKG